MKRYIKKIQNQENLTQKEIEEVMNEIIAKGGNLSTDQAAEYVKRLKKEKRYQRRQESRWYCCFKCRCDRF